MTTTSSSSNNNYSLRLQPSSWRAEERLRKNAKKMLDSCQEVELQQRLRQMTRAQAGLLLLQFVFGLLAIRQICAAIMFAKHHGKTDNNIVAPTSSFDFLVSLPSLYGNPRTSAPWRTSAELLLTTTTYGKQAAATTRHFLFEDPNELLFSNGVHMTSAERQLQDSIREQLLSFICSNTQQQKSCQNEEEEEEAEILRCMSCSGTNDWGEWYSAVTPTGAATGLFDGSGTALSIESSIPSYLKTWRFDISVPLSGQDEQMKRFAKRLGEYCFKKKWWPDHVTLDVRLLTTRYHPTDELPPEKELALRKELATLARLPRGPEAVQFIPLQPRKGSSIVFSRSQAGNALHRNACNDDDVSLHCIVMVMDVDMDLRPSFFRNALSLIVPGVSAYTPIVWSEYNPNTWQLVDKLLQVHEKKNKTSLPQFSPHRGIWRQYGFGIYAIAGADAKHVLYKEDFDGWGGEDNVFIQQLEHRLHVIRRKERGLIHKWHAKVCDPSFVVPSQLRACVGSAASVEGSELGLHLQRLIQTRQLDRYNAVMKPPPPPPIALWTTTMLQSVDDPILVVVAANRKTFQYHVTSIAQTWGNRAYLPPHVTVWYVVGDGGGGPKDDAAQLAAKIPNDVVRSSQICILDGVNDDDPVLKNAAMFQHVSQRIIKSSSSSQFFKWILKVNEDTYVNAHGLQLFVNSLHDDDNAFQVWGQQGMGRPEDQPSMRLAGAAAFCMGGPGYLMNVKTWHATAHGLDDTIAHIESLGDDHKSALWKPDVVIGLATQRATQTSCWAKSSSPNHDHALHSILFAENYQHHSSSSFVKEADLHRVITLHPFKDHKSMLQQHDRFHPPRQGGTLIVVVTTRARIVSRVAALRYTWAGTSLKKKEDDVTIWYLIGDGGTDSDTAALAEKARVPIETVVVTTGVHDTSDAVKRSTATITAVATKILNIGRKFDWILRVDDDTFVNVHSLESFTKSLDASQYQIWGRRGFGKVGAERDAFLQAGITKPFCLLSSGYIMSFVTWMNTAQGMEDCLQEAKAAATAASTKTFIWKADVIVGKCVQRATQSACWDRKDYDTSSKVFLPKTSSAAAATTHGELEITITFPFPSDFA